MTMKPRAILICAVVVLAGCRDSANAPRPLHADLGETISIEQRYHSITGRIRKGMSMADARLFLCPCTPTRFHGPETDLSTGTTTWHEEWAWVFRSSNGMIVVHSTTGLQSDLVHGVVSNVSFHRMVPAQVVSNGVKTVNTLEHIP